ncbi:hypothetical protein BZA77DRAFT_341153 [Pyronema omphalodes]|nr:hypothetical protein BZA77DRAFT_341153 [Pyronema omphalodes]
MPNKKARVRNQNATFVDFDIEPTALAKTSNLSATKERKRKSRKRRWEQEDDTPKAFVRLMKGPARNGLDNGDSGNKKKKAKTIAAEEAEKERKAELKIQPGESLREFGKRVDAAIPVVFPRGDGSKPLKEKKKKEKKQKEEVDPTVEPEEGEEVHSDDDDELKEQLREAEANFQAAKRVRNGGRAKDEEDIWAGLEKKREKIAFGDVAHAPPVLKKPKALLYVGGSKALVDVEGIPRKSGSLAKREELAGERRNLIEQYREMMAAKRGPENTLN